MLAPLAMWKPASATTPVASFDWSMPDRFGLDRNGDGLIDYVDGSSDHVTGYDPTPDSWHVDLDACASSAGSGATYVWTVVDQPDPAAPITVQGGPGCGDFFMDVPEEGTYRVDLVVDSGGVRSTPLRRDVVVQDWLIVSLGDSYGSGEGSPDIPIDQSELAEVQAAWDESLAARQAILQFELDVQPLNAALARWQDALDRAAHFCDVSADWFDAGECLRANGDIVVESGIVAFEAAKLGISATGQFIGDFIHAVAEFGDALVQTFEAAVQVAKSVTGQLSATWEAARCHRSANSGSAQAAKALEDADPHTSVTFIHLACSGASMVYGLLGWYAGTEFPDGVTNVNCNQPNRPAACIRPQFDVAEELVGSREVDATYISIGGNDAHFADIVIACILQTDCSTENPVSDPGDFLANFCPNLDPIYLQVVEEMCRNFFEGLPSLMDTAADLIEEGINGDVREPIDPMFPGLAVGYQRVADRVVGAGHLLPAGREDRVFLSQYVDAVKRDDGVLCDFDSMGFDSIPGLSTAESAYIDGTIIPTLFGAIQQATTAHQWTYVNGIYDGFTNHGYCAQDHYMVRAQETFLNEGRYHGMVHPNASGYAVYASNILNKWDAAFYPNGLSGEPRRPDQRPYADAGAAVSVVEGGSATLANASRDSDGDALSFAWTHDRPGKVTIAPAAAAAPTLVGVDDTSGTATVTVSDADGTRTDATTFTVTNADPVIGSTASLDAPVPLGVAVSANVPFTDAGVLDTHTATIDWGDATTSAATITESNGSGTASANHGYAAAGLYPVTVTVTDDDGGTASVRHEFVVVYDASGGFATGGGWFMSPSGAYTPNDPSDTDATGRAQFAFVSKYVKGSTVPTGTTSFRFTAAGLEFASATYDWMVVSGTKATYRGTGAVDGVGGYRFMLVANDGDSKAGGVDQLRVRIWDDATGTVVYDNQAGAALDANPVTTIGGGQIAVHK